MFEYYPKTSDIKKLVEKKPLSVTIYETFNVRSFRDNWRTVILNHVKNLTKDAGFSKEDRDVIIEKVTGTLGDKNINHPNVAVFANVDEVKIYNLINRVESNLSYGTEYNITPLLRTLANPRKGYALNVGLKGWDLYEFDGPEPPVLVEVDKGRGENYETFTAEVVEKHIIQRSHKDVRNDHQRRYVTHILNTVKPIIQDGLTVVFGPENLTSQIVGKNGLINSVKKDLIVESYEAIFDLTHKTLEEVYLFETEKVLENAYGQLKDGLSTIDLSELGKESIKGNIKALYINDTYQETGTWSETNGVENLNGNTLLVSKMIQNVILTGGKVFVLRDDNVWNENWDSTFIAVKRWK